MSWVCVDQVDSVMIEILFKIIMGPSHSNPFRQGGQLLSQFSVTGKNHELFITYLKHKRTNKDFLLRELTFTQQRELILNCQKLKSRKAIQNDHLTHIEKIQQRAEDNMCSHYYKIYTLWEYPSKPLFEEIKERDLQKKSFQNREMWSVLACSIMGLAALQQKEIRHECLTTKSILMDGGNIKIADPLASGLQANYDCIFNNRTLKNIYLSPEQCEAIQSQKPIINKNSFKNDVFTMGMIMLQCGLLERQDQCYLDDCSKINWSKIQANLCRFGHIYQEDLKKIVTLMLEKDIRNRPDWVDLNKFVGRGNTQGTKSEKTLPKRDHFITRTVRSLLPKNEQKHDSAAAGPGSQVPPNEPYYSQFYGVMVGQTSHRPVEMRSTTPNRTINSTQITFNRPNQTSYAPSSVQFSSLQRENNFKLAYTSLPYQPVKSSQIPLPKFDVSPQQVNPNPKVVTPLPLPNLPALQLNEGISKRISLGNAAYDKNEEANFPTFRFNNQPNITIEKRSPQKVATFQPPLFKSDFNSIGRVAQSNIPAQSIYMSSIDKGRSATNQNSFSPVNNISQYVRPAQSVNYEVPKASSGANSIPLQSAFRRSDYVDTNSIDIKPEFVVEHFKVGSKYEGYKLNGQRHGKGKFFYQDGGFYDGQWYNNQMQGYGTLYYQSNHKAYEGKWVGDQFHGQGKLYNDQPFFFDSTFDYNNFDDIDDFWQCYQGNFEHDEKDGKGILKFSNGQVFIGTFKKDMVEGEGTFNCLDGRKIHGIWRQNHLVTLLN